VSDFDLAIAVVLANEGGYVFDPEDPGGETFRGISRKDFPAWPGWAAVDAAKRLPNFGAAVMRDASLLQEAKDFYHASFWNPLYEQINSQAVATKLLDTSVNMGMATAVRLLQQAIGYLCAGPVVTDGIFGARTLDFVNGASEADLFRELRARAAKRHHDVAIANAAEEKFVLGWFRRDVQ
jgi:lysozyme family protein